MKTDCRRSEKGGGGAGGSLREGNAGVKVKVIRRALHLIKYVVQRKCAPLRYSARTFQLRHMQVKTVDRGPAERKTPQGGILQFQTFLQFLHLTLTPPPWPSRADALCFSAPLPPTVLNIEDG